MKNKIVSKDSIQLLSERLQCWLVRIEIACTGSSLKYLKPVEQAATRITCKFNREWLHLVYENKSSEYWAVELCEDFNDQTKG